MKEIFQISLSYDSVALKVWLKPIKRKDFFCTIQCSSDVSL